MSIVASANATALNQCIDGTCTCVASTLVTKMEAATVAARDAARHLQGRIYAPGNPLHALDLAIAVTAKFAQLDLLIEQTAQATSVGFCRCCRETDLNEAHAAAVLDASNTDALIKAGRPVASCIERQVATNARLELLSVQQSECYCARCTHDPFAQLDDALHIAATDAERTAITAVLTAAITRFDAAAAVHDSRCPKAQPQ